MKVLLLGGNEVSGKSDALIRLHDWLQTQGFQCTPNTHDTNQGETKDFICFMPRTIGKIKYVILNTAADDSGCTQKLKTFISNLNLSKLDEKELLFISAIRNPIPSTNNNNPRTDLLNLIKSQFGISANQCVEIPMLHLDARLSYQEQWLKAKTDETVQNVLKSPAIGL